MFSRVLKTDASTGSSSWSISTAAMLIVWNSGSAALVSESLPKARPMQNTQLARMAFSLQICHECIQHQTHSNIFVKWTMGQAGLRPASFEPYSSFLCHLHSITLTSGCKSKVACNLKSSFEIFAVYFEIKPFFFFKIISSSEIILPCSIQNTKQDLLEQYTSRATS